MFRYKLGYHSCEESYYFEVEHETLYSQDTLCGFIAEYLDEYEHRQESEGILFSSYQDIFHPFADDIPSIKDWLIKNKGFVPIEYTEVISVFGWAQIEDKTSWQDYREEGDFIDIINKKRKIK